MADAKPKPKLAKSWWWAKEADGEDSSPPDVSLYSEHEDENASWVARSKKLVQESYETDIFKGSKGPYPAVVLKVLAGQSAGNEASTGGQATKGASTSANRNWWEQFSALEGKLSPVRVIARPLSMKGTSNGVVFNGGIPAPWDLKKDATDAEIEQNISLHPEFVALKASQDKDQDLSSIVPGTPIFVDFPQGQNPARANGVIVGVIKDYTPKAAEVKTSPKEAHNPQCEFIPGSEPEEGFYAGHTVGTLRSGRRVSKIRNKIKTGVYGNGTAQTKAHFLECLFQAKNPSPKHKIKGPSPGQNNCFLWVGHLRYNGYLDSVDRPSDLGRETIIYAPKTLDISAPIEIKYYFHDAGGFGYAWLNGPLTTTKQAIESAALPGCDFKEKIAPMIKDLNRDGRNYVLVIPEMMHSRGYGTGLSDDNRLTNIMNLTAAGQGLHGAKDTIRTYLDSSPTKSQDRIRSHLGGMTIASDKAENLLSVQRLKNRYMKTFDRSFTGGNFAVFHTQIKGVLSEHLSQALLTGFDSEDSQISIVADNAGALTLAHIPTEDLLSLGSKLTRIDWINAAGLDFHAKPWSLYFENSSATQYFDDKYLKSLTWPIEFNYIAPMPAQSDVKLFFKNQGQEAKLTKFKNQKGQCFTYHVGNDSSIDRTITYHQHTGENKGAEYAFTMKNSSTGLRALRKRRTIGGPINQGIPDHAASISHKKNDSAILVYEKQRTDLVSKQIEPFETALGLLGQEGTTGLCQNSPHFCKPDGLGGFDLYANADSAFASSYTAWKSATQKYYELNELINLEIVMKEVVEQKRELKDVKSYYSSLKEVNASAMPNAKSALKNYEFFSLTNFPPNNVASVNSARDFVIAIMQTLGTNDAILKAENRIQEYERLLKAGPPTREPSPCDVGVTALARLSASPSRRPKDNYLNFDCDSVKPVHLPRKFADLVRMIPFYPKKSDYIDAKLNKILTPGEVPGFELAGFKYPARTSNDVVKIHDSAKDSVRIWKCLVPLVEEGMKAATDASKFAPYKVTHGFRAGPPPGMTDSVSLHSYGLALDIDPCLNGWDNKGELTAVQFTNGYRAHKTSGKAGWGDNWSFASDHPEDYSFSRGERDAISSLLSLRHAGVYAESLDQLMKNIASNSTSLDSPEKIKAWLNSSSSTGLALRQAHEYDSSGTVWQPGNEYGGYLKDIKNSLINPLGSNPLLWVITFCEFTGMKWGNGTFLKKRYRGGDVFKYQDLGDAAAGSFYHYLDELFGIKDVMRRVQAISWDSDVNDFMHFQWYDAPHTTIPFTAGEHAGARQKGIAEVAAANNIQY